MLWSDVFTAPHDNKGPIYFGPLAGYEKEKPAGRRGGAPGEQDKTPEEVKAAWKKGIEGDLYGPDDVPTWDEFTQNTTFHGIRYVFDRTPYKCRRYVWMGVVVLAVLLFVAQVSERMVVYLQYKTNVAVEVKYIDTVTFPSVTICNQNNFRITATVEWNLYDFIDNVYSVNLNQLAELDVSSYSLTGLNTTDFMTTTTHDKTDLIESCTWHGNRCNLDNDFVTTLTDLGVCYTFNMKKPALQISEPGSGAALSLILNVEQYEYMKGPQNDAGIKMQLHHQGETPSMRDQGFAVAPGTHTLVGVKRVVVNSLPSPFGTCAEQYNTPVTECKKNCRTVKVVEACQCRDFYMNYLEEAPSEVCNMTQAFICSQLVHESIRRNRSDCMCPIPCYTIKYEPSLSYAQLSRHNTDRYLVPEQHRKTAIEEKFRKALETSQRALKKTATSDEKQMSEILSLATSLFDLLNTTDSVSDTIDFLIQEYKIVDLISTNIIEEDIKYLKDNSEHVFGNANFWSSYYEFLGSQALRYAESMLQIENHNESKVLRYFKACDATNDTIVTLIENGPLNNDENTLRSKSISKETGTVMPASVTTFNGKNVTNRENLCNDSHLNHFNDSIWQEFMNLLNSDQTEDNHFVEIRNAWMELPFFLRTYIGLENFKQKIELEVNITEIFEILCNNSMVTTTQTMVTEVTEFIPTVPVISATLASDVINCTAIFDEVKKNYFAISLSSLERYIPYLFSYKDKYLNFVEKIYFNMSEILEVIPQHLRCISTINFLENMAGELNKFYDLMVATAEIESVEEAIPVLHKLHASYLLWNSMNDNFTTYGNKIDRYEYCRWTSRSLEDEKADIIKEFETLEGAVDYKIQARLYMEAVFKAYARSESIFTMKILPTLKQLNSYLEGNITKRELAINFNKAILTKGLNDLEDAASEMTSYIKDFKNDVATLTLKATEGFEELTKFTLPIFNKVHASKLSFTKAVRNLKRKDFEEMLESFDDDFTKSFSDLLRKNYDEFVSHTAETVNKISYKIKELISKIRSLRNDLSNYRTSTNMDVDFYMENFIQVDVFYQEISYEEIQQNEGFEFLSLLSEIGGFLGLLLGASVLTVCELLDYVTLWFLHKCRSHKVSTRNKLLHYEHTQGPKGLTPISV